MPDRLREDYYLGVSVDRSPSLAGQLKLAWSPDLQTDMTPEIEKKIYIFQATLSYFLPNFTPFTSTLSYIIHEIHEKQSRSNHIILIYFYISYQYYSITILSYS